jgi:hypothetical protein
MYFIIMVKILVASFANSSGRLLVRGSRMGTSVNVTEGTLSSGVDVDAETDGAGAPGAGGSVVSLLRLPIIPRLSVPMLLDRRSVREFFNMPAEVGATALKLL